MGWGLPAQARQSDTAAGAASSPRQIADPQQLFEQGEAALKSDDLGKAEHDFRAVIALNPQVAGAYANLGVVYMRRKDWPQALAMLKKAEHLAPKVSGIRLNIGLVYYRQNDFAKAIPPFESVLHVPSPIWRSPRNRGDRSLFDKLSPSHFASLGRPKRYGRRSDRCGSTGGNEQQELRNPLFYSRDSLKPSIRAGCERHV